MLRFARPDELSDDYFRNDDVLQGTVATDDLRDRPGRVWVEIGDDPDSLCFYGQMVQSRRNPLIVLEGDSLRGPNIAVICG